MRRLPPKIRRRLNYATVVAALTAFVVLVAGGAYAANQIAKNSVGTKQLKKNSVTAAKLKKNAVTTAKVKKSAVTGAKLKDGTLVNADLAANPPFQRIVEEIRSAGSVSVPNGTEKLTILPLENPNYTQPAGRTDSYVGAVDVSFAPSCVGRAATALLLVDSKTPGEISMLDLGSFAAAGTYVEPAGSAAVTKRLNLGPYIGGYRYAPTSPTTHTFSLGVVTECMTGSGVTAANAAIDVIGTP